METDPARSGETTRRQVLLGTAAAVPLTLFAAPPALATSASTAESTVDTSIGRYPGRLRYLDPHQAAVVVEATARLVPGPADDPAEAGHPGAREAGVVQYIDGLLAAVDFAPEHVHAAGPWSDRHGGATNFMAGFVPLSHAQRIAWTRRIEDWRDRYRAGLAQLDALADGDFTAVPAARRDRILAAPTAAEFVDLLFGHTVEGLYSNPEYGGNRGLSGWRDISFPGDSQPRGYTADEVSRSDGPDPVRKSAMVDDFAAFLENPPE